MVKVGEEWMTSYKSTWSLRLRGEWASKAEQGVPDNSQPWLGVCLWTQVAFASLLPTLLFVDPKEWDGLETLWTAACLGCHLPCLDD